MGSTELIENGTHERGYSRGFRNSDAPCILYNPQGKIEKISNTSL